MTANDDLIPRPPVIRERLAQTRREAARLRKLLRLSEDAAIERHKQASSDTPETVHKAPGREEGR
ncbi:hypothetical protein [Aquisphaera insulae]|uniref:hypothetical protein n=1 Tax=Aquisphaera insulae TaxID=2712864 RepID=UPI0013EA4ED8|nr:hypothetical protein [Aquisphaera insulae]